MDTPAGAPPRDARIAEKRDVGAGLVLVALDVDDFCRDSYTTPGQYAELTIGDDSIRDPGSAKNGYFALASDVLRAPWELVVKDSGGASRALLEAAVGAPLSVTTALGSGFEVHRADGVPAVIAVSGSAISVARPLLSWRAARDALASTFLYVGVRSVEETPLPDELSAWARRGVRVVLCASRDASGGLDGVEMTSGYVQDAITAAVATGALPGDAVAFVAGHDAMTSALRDGTGGPALASVYMNV
jgi:NAD(P)H-flavin reductase